MTDNTILQCPANVRRNMAVNLRKIYVNDVITQELIDELLYYLYSLVDLDNDAGTKRPIEIILNTDGGSVEAGNTLIGYIEYLKHIGYEITTTNAGKAYSMGFAIALCGTKRRCYPHARYMFHDIAFGTVGKAKEIEENVEYAKALRDDQDNTIILKYSNLTKEELDGWRDRKIDKYFSADEALKYKITDEVM